MVSLRSGCDGEDGEAWEGETDVLRHKLQTVTRLCKGLKVKSAVLEEQVESLKARQEHSHARETELRAQTEAAAQCRQTLEKEREQWAQERAQLQETIEQLQRRTLGDGGGCVARDPGLWGLSVGDGGWSRGPVPFFPLCHRTPSVMLQLPWAPPLASCVSRFSYNGSD